jgi:hypothetical protein
MISIGNEIRFRHKHWTVGFCPRCDAFEAIRVGAAVERTDLSGIPISSSEIGRVGLCDACERIAQPAPGARLIPLRKWSYRDGLQRLFDISAPCSLGPVAQIKTDAEFHRLLKRIKQASSVRNLNIGAGFILGGIVGAGIGLLISSPIAHSLGFDPISVGVVLFVGVGTLGAVAGSVVDVIRIGHRTASRMVSSAIEKYEIDLQKLAELAEGYPSRIRRAVRYRS